jgi:predicted amidohydrolase
MAACMAAIVSGCFVASTNRRSYDSAAFAGRSWLVSPEGEILGETSADIPYLTVEIDLEEANRAKDTYPRNLAAIAELERYSRGDTDVGHPVRPSDRVDAPSTSS